MTMACAVSRLWAVCGGVPCRLRGARLDALMATWLVPPALAVALAATLPTYAELTPVALTSAVLHVPFTVARLVLREAATAARLLHSPVQRQHFGGWSTKTLLHPPKCSATSLPLIPPRRECRSGADAAARQCSA